MQVSDSLRPGLRISIKLVHEEHSPHGDTDDLQVFFPLKSSAGKSGSVGIDGEIVIHWKMQKGTAGCDAGQSDEDQKGDLLWVHNNVQGLKFNGV